MRTGLIGWVKKIIANPFLLYALGAIVLLALIIHYLGSQPSGLSPAEQLARNNSHSVKQIIDQPINAPHNLLTYGLHAASARWQTALRLSSVAFALVFIWSFYSLARSWFGKYIGFMGGLLLATTPLVLVLARQGSAEVMYLGLLAIMAAYAWMQRTDKSDLAFGVLLICCALMLYTPGVIWWLVGGLVMARKKLASILESVTPPAAAASFLVAILILVPLITALIKDWTLIKGLLLIPIHFAAPLTIIKEVVWMVIALFAKAPYHNSLIIGRLPILSVIETALLIFGTYAMWTAARTKVLSLVASIIFAIVAAGINNNLALLALALPPIAVIVTAGLRYLYIEWRGIFPKNPVAHGLALSLMAVIVVMQLLFGIRYAIVAWPLTDDVKNTYVLK